MDKVYVIYFDGKMYESRSRKTVYLKESSAKQVITSESKELAKNMYNNETGKDYYYLSNEQGKIWIDKAKNRFKIITCVREED